MTGNEALAESIRNYIESGVDLSLTDDDYRTIIKALEQEPCEDCISREYFINDLLLKAQGEKDVSIKWLTEYINSLPR